MTTTTKIAKLLVVLIVGAMMSGCIETREISTPTIAPTSDSVYAMEEIHGYLTTHTLSAGFGNVQLTLHPDKTVTCNGETGTWIATGTGSGKWSCAVQGIKDVKSIRLYTGHTAELWTGEEDLIGCWFR